MAITWLAGYPKSGTTYLRLFLSALTEGCLDINRLGPFSHDDLARYLWQVVSPKPLNDLGQTEAFACRSAVLAHMLTANLGRVYCKTHSAVGQAAGFPLIPEAMTDRGVYVLRDPRDVAVSYAHHTQQSVDFIIDSMCENHCLVKAPGLYNALGPWHQHVTSWANSEAFPVRVVRYEDMVEKPYETFAGIAGFLGLKGDIERAVELSSFKSVKQQEQDQGFRESSETGAEFFRRGQAGSWRDELHAEQARRLEQAHGEVMRQFGYEMNDGSTQGKSLLGSP